MGCRAARGFTLVELLVAITVMALLGLAAWRGVDAMALALGAARGHADQVAIAQTALAQWQSDLDHAQESGIVAAMEHDGRVFRLTREGIADGAAGLRVVAWTRRDGPQGARWLRWQSGALGTRVQLLAAWDAAARWGRGDGLTTLPGEVELAAIDDLQVFFFRNDAWRAPLSAAGAVPVYAGVPAGPPGAGPDGVRLVVTLAAGHALSGAITQDWARPSLGAGRS